MQCCGWPDGALLQQLAQQAQNVGVRPSRAAQLALWKRLWQLRSEGELREGAGRGVWSGRWAAAAANVAASLQRSWDSMPQLVPKSRLCSFSHLQIKE